jgi:hypothetical protein
MTLLGYITWYLYLTPSPLRCGGVYDTTVPWVAMGIDAKYAVCGDKVIITGEDGIPREFIVRDSGHLSKYCIKERDGGCVEIIADIPRHAVWWEGMSTKAMVENVDMGTRTRDDSRQP